MSTTIDQLIQRGYGYVLAAEIEGIGVVFAERIPQRVDAASAPTLPTNYTAASASLLIQSGQKISIEMDRDTGIGRGDAWEILLSWGALEDEGLLPTLFKRPTLLGRLPGSLAYNATTITVDDVTGWPASGTAYLGRERIDYTGVNSGANQFTGCTRAVLGYNYEIDGNDPGDFRTLTNTPAIWRGRFVTLHQHIVSPEGRMLDSTWFAGSYHRELWKGFIDAPPVPDVFGMRLRALPLVRLLSRPFGSAAELAIIEMGDGLNSDGDSPGQYPVVVRNFGAPLVDLAAAALTVSVYYRQESDLSLHTVTSEAGAWSSSWDSIYTTNVVPLDAWIEKVKADLKADLVTSGPFTALGWGDWGNDTSMGPNVGASSFFLKYDSDDYTIYSITVDVREWCYWTHFHEAKIGTGLTSTTGTYAGVRLIWKIFANVGCYIPVRVPSGEPLVPASIPAASIGWLSAGEDELIRWDEKLDIAWWPNAVALRVAERGVGQSYSSTGGKVVRARLREGGTLSVVTGDVTQFTQAIGEILQSSGTSAGGGAAGTRGSSDLLGAGYGIPSGWIAPFYVVPPFQSIYPIVSNGSASLAELVGGMLVLGSRCMVQRRDSGDDVVIEMVSMSPEEVTGPDVTISSAEIETSGHGVPQLVDGPNIIEVDSSGGPYKRRDYVVKSIARIQQEGARSLSLSAPGVRLAPLVSSAAALLHRGRGQSVLTLSVAPWVSVQVGDRVKLTTAHPTQYDFGTAARSPASTSARVVGYALDLWTGQQVITLKTSGLTDVSVSLCPTWKVTNVSSKVVTLDTDAQMPLTHPASGGLSEGESVIFYRIGYEDTYEEAGTIASISGNTVTMNTAPSAWVGTGTDIRCTYPTLTSASTSQSTPFLYVSATKVWS